MVWMVQDKLNTIEHHPKPGAMGGFYLAPQVVEQGFDFPPVDDAIMDSSEAHNNQMMQLLSDPAKAAGFAKVVFELLKLAE